MSTELIKLQEIYKVFETEDIETTAVNNVSLSIFKGEYVAISGPSGCGKSTLLSIIGLLDRPSRGSYLFGGKETSSMSKTELSNLRNRELGFIFQSFNLIDNLNIVENVKLPLMYRGDISKHEKDERAIEALNSVGLSHRATHLPSQLSGGQQQRVAVARALVSHPSIILADEPTGNLDSKSADTIMALLSSLHENGTTICMVTHDPRYTSYASRTIHVLDGTVQSVSTQSIESEVA